MSALLAREAPHYSRTYLGVFKYRNKVCTSLPIESGSACSRRSKMHGVMLIALPPRCGVVLHIICRSAFLLPAHFVSSCRIASHYIWYLGLLIIRLKSAVLKSRSTCMFSTYMKACIFSTYMKETTSITVWSQLNHIGFQRIYHTHFCLLLLDTTWTKDERRSRIRKIADLCETISQWWSNKIVTAGLRAPLFFQMFAKRWMTNLLRYPSGNKFPIKAIRI